MSAQRTSTRRGKQLTVEFFEEGRRLDADPETRHLANCWLCHQRIDYQVPPNTTPDSHNKDHYYPVADFPELQDDPEGWRHSHQLCNVKRGKSTPTGGGLGTEVPAWW
jgi:hypothetical protein